MRDTVIAVRSSDFQKIRDLCEKRGILDELKALGISIVELPASVSHDYTNSDGKVVTSVKTHPYADIYEGLGLNVYGE